MFVPEVHEGLRPRKNLSQILMMRMSYPQLDWRADLRAVLFRCGSKIFEKPSEGIEGLLQ